MKRLKIIFAGTPDFGIACLEAIFKSHHDLIAVYTQPDRPKGRGQKLEQSAIKTWATEHKIPCYQPPNFKNPEDILELEKLRPDLMVVIAYGLILPQGILDIPVFGCINVHASLLPRWRGASPILQSILHKDKTTGISIMQMDKGMDTGDVLLQKSLKIEPSDTTLSLTKKLGYLAVTPLMQVIDNIALNKLEKNPQKDELATYAPKILKQDAHINWEDTAVNIDHTIRAYLPWPVAFSYVNDLQMRIHQGIKINKTSTEKAGTIIEITKHGIEVATLDGVILIEKLQFPGGKIISAIDLLNSQNRKLYKGLILT